MSNITAAAPAEFEDTLLVARKQLAERIKNGEPAPEGELKGLPLRDIHTCPAVFQHRSGNQAASRAHVSELVKSLKRNPERPLDPILVFWIGDRWCCIDGHHRLEAYQEARFKKSIPVTRYKSDLDNAIAAALRGNSKDKLPMSRPEKSESAWRLVISTDLSKATIANAANVSERTVASMREVKGKLISRQVNTLLDTLRWRDADRIAKGIEPMEAVSDDWKQAKAQAIADRLCKHFGKRLGENPEITAMAFEIYDSRLPQALSEWWGIPEDDDDFEEDEESDF